MGGGGIAVKKAKETDIVGGRGWGGNAVKKATETDARQTSRQTHRSPILFITNANTLS